jgi:hypothetical protein
VRGRSVDVLGAEIGDLVSLLAPADERAVDVGVLRQSARLVRRRPEWVLASLERVDAPALLAVVRVDGGQALDGHLGTDLVRALADLRELRGDGEVVAAEERLAAHLDVLHRGEPLRAAAGLDVPGDDFIDGQGSCSCRQRGTKGEEVHGASGRARILRRKTPRISRV